jgi:hypothetical protein
MSSSISRPQALARLVSLVLAFMLVALVLASLSAAAAKPPRALRATEAASKVAPPPAPAMRKVPRSKLLPRDDGTAQAAPVKETRRASKVERRDPFAPVQPAAAERPSFSRVRPLGRMR